MTSIDLVVGGSITVGRSTVVSDDVLPLALIQLDLVGLSLDFLQIPLISRDFQFLAYDDEIFAEPIVAL